MKQSISYYLTLFVLKLKGIKKEFSKDPIDVKKIRKEDVYLPKGVFFKKHEMATFQVLGSSVTEIKQKNPTKKLVIFIHGGAFISGPAKHHWDSIKEIIKRTQSDVWMCNYPKAPEHTISEISKNIDVVYEMALQKYPDTEISLLGDSVGATLIIALTQRLIAAKGLLPKLLILISPVMDASMSNPDIDAIEPKDPMLSKAGILSAKKLCAENSDLKNEMISPLFGNFSGFPNTVMFLAKHDIMYPDAKLAILKFQQENIPVSVIEGENMPHIWPLLPVMKEAKTALHQIIAILNAAS